MVDFRFYLNRSGLRGAKGEKGDTGFSPTIVEGTNNVNTYTLKIKNEFDEFETPNLRGDSIDISDPDGTYIRYNQLTGKSYVGSVDRASVDIYGMVRIADEYDFENFSSDSAVTPASYVDNLPNFITSPDGSVRINQNPENSKIELRVDTGSISSLETRVEHLEDDTLYLENAVNDLSTGLATTNSNVNKLNISLNGVKSDLTTEAQVRLNADSQQQQAIDAERQQREIQDASLQNQLNTKLTVDNIKQGENITITKNGNNVTINSTGGVNIDDIEPSTTKVYSSSKTSDLVGELGNEVNSIAGRLNTLEDTVVVATSNKLGLVKPDNTTIVINTDGTLTAIGGGGGGVSPQDVAAAINTHNTDTESHEDIREALRQVQLYKFPNATIEGDPTINNGQVSNFSTTNFLRFPFEFKTEGRTWLLNGSFDTDSDVTNQQNIIDSLASVALAVRNGRLVLALSTNGISFDLGEHLSMSDIEPNTKYYYRLSFSGTQYLLSISTDKQEWLPEIIVTSDQPIASKPMTISSSGYPFKGTINLNDYDLTVGNLLVWQGMDDVGIASRMDVNGSNATDSAKEVMLNTNGLESGKQDTSDAKLFNEVLDRERSSFDLSKFTVVGNPTITDDGVASGFSSGNYLTKSLSELATNNYKLSFKINSGTIGTQQTILSQPQTTTQLTGLRISKLSDGRLNIAIGDGSNVQQFNVQNFNFVANTNYSIDFECKNSNYYVYINNSLKHTVACTVYININYPMIYIGGRFNSASVMVDTFNGSIDLKQFSITVDGQEVFNGNKTGIDIIDNIEIPYILSKTGSKIVDVQYKDRVQEAYNHQGEAIYYVLDKEKSTTQLPKGDIYGMITKINDAIGNIGDLLDIINGEQPIQTLSAIPMMLSLEATELDIENSFASNNSKAVFSEDMQITPLKEEFYDDDTDIDLGGNE